MEIDRAGQYASSHGIRLSQFFQNLGIHQINRWRVAIYQRYRQGMAWGTSVLFSPFLVPIATAAGVVYKHADPQNALRWLATRRVIRHRATGTLNSRNGAVL